MVPMLAETFCPSRVVCRHFVVHCELFTTVRDATLAWAQVLPSVCGAAVGLARAAIQLLSSCLCERYDDDYPMMDSTSLPLSLPSGAPSRQGSVKTALSKSTSELDHRAVAARGSSGSWHRPATVASDKA